MQNCFPYHVHSAASRFTLLHAAMASPVHPVPYERTSERRQAKITVSHASERTTYERARERALADSRFRQLFLASLHSFARSLGGSYTRAGSSSLISLLELEEGGRERVRAERQSLSLSLSPFPLLFIPKFFSPVERAHSLCRHGRHRHRIELYRDARGKMFLCSI